MFFLALRTFFYALLDSVISCKFTGHQRFILLSGSFFAFRGSVISWKFTGNQRFFVASDVENVWGSFSA